MKQAVQPVKKSTPGEVQFNFLEEILRKKISRRHRAATGKLLNILALANKWGTFGEKLSLNSEHAWLLSALAKKYQGASLLNLSSETAQFLDIIKECLQWDKYQEDWNNRMVHMELAGASGSILLEMAATRFVCYYISPNLPQIALKLEEAGMGDVADVLCVLVCATREEEDEEA